MTGIQALERIAPGLPMKPGKVERCEFEYRRHGTQTLIAGFDVTIGKVVGVIGDTRTEQDFARFLDTLLSSAAANTRWDIVCDNLALVQLSQQGPKLVGTFAVGASNQGESVALSPDGNTAIIGGPGDSSGAGAAWVYTRSGGAWGQQGSKLLANDAVAGAFSQQGESVALSADGNTAIVGAPGDNAGVGAASVYTRRGIVWTQ
jgi:hypothetical protein